MDATLYPTLPAADMARARTWYHDKLGLDPVEEMPDGTAWYEMGDSRFLLYPSQFAGTNQATAAAFITADFDGTMQELRDRGVVFEEDDFGEDFRTVGGVMTMPDGMRAAWFKDSEGNIIGMDSPSG
jgi:catechol 2,3-dioxygenase-like lactoylglutathione lyase family enzyme